MKARSFVCLIIFVLLPSLLAMSSEVNAATDSTAQSYPKKVNPMYPSQSSAGTSNFTGDAPYLTDSSGKPYPPCPGDPSNPTFPRTPTCPDINNAWPKNFINMMSPASSTYSQAAHYNNPNFSTLDIYCPDACITTRYTNPAAPTSIMYSPQPVDSFEMGSCPAGYVEVSEFNTQPGIANIKIENKVYGPFDSMTEFLYYKNNSAFRCSITVDTVANDISISSVMTLTDSSEGTYNVDTTQATNYADGNPDFVCSAPMSQEIDLIAGTPATVGPDVAPSYGQDLLVNGKVGQWVSKWTWSPFYIKNHTKSIDPFKWYYQSFDPGDSLCTGSGNNTPNYQSDYVNHRDAWYHYYRWERCVPIASTAWFFVDSYQPVSRFCVRVKSGWQQYN